MIEPLLWHYVLTRLVLHIFNIGTGYTPPRHPSQYGIMVSVQFESEAKMETERYGARTTHRRKPSPIR